MFDAMLRKKCMQAVIDKLTPTIREELLDPVAEASVGLASPGHDGVRGIGLRVQEEEEQRQWALVCFEECTAPVLLHPHSTQG